MHQVSKFTALFLFALLPAQLFAADKKPAPGAVLDKAGLQECVALQDEMNQKVKLYNVQVREGNAVLKKLEPIRADIGEIRKEIDAGNDSRMDLYNAKIDENNALVEEHDGYKLRMAAIASEKSALADRFNEKCAGKRYLESQMYEVRSKKK